MNDADELIGEIAAIFDSHIESLAAFERSLELLCEEADWSYAEIWIPDETNRLSCLTCHWMDEKFEEFVAITRVVRFGRGEGLPGRVWASGESESIENLNVTSSFEFPRASNASFVGLRHAYAVPIEHGDRFIGVLAAAATVELSSEKPHRITERFAHEIGEYIDQLT